MSNLNCEQMEQLLPDYFQGALSPVQTAEVEQHAEHCATCAQDIVMWKQLAMLPEEKPSPESRQRFEAMLHAYSATADETAPASPAQSNVRAPRATSTEFARPSWNFLE